MYKSFQSSNCATPPPTSAVNLDDVVVDCQLLIIEELDIPSLITIAQINSYYKDLAMNVFQRKHAHKILKIACGLRRSTEIISESSGHITIKSYGLTLMVFRTFGSIIKKLELALHTTELNQRKVIHEHISEYCSDSLLSIQLNNVVEDELEEFSTPLKKVENVTISRELNTNDGKFTIAKVFPGVRRLSLEHITAFDGFMLYVTIPTLEEVQIVLPFSEGFLTSMQMFFEKNPQIRSLTLSYHNSIHCLEIASKWLKYLEELNIDFSQQSHVPDAEIHFGNVKKLTAIADRKNYFDIITFDHLEELDLTCHSSECTGFAMKNQNVSKLTITAQSISGEQILKIGKLLGNLTELSIENKYAIKAETIIRLTGEIKHLNKLKLNLPGDTMYQTLWHHFGGRGGELEIRQQDNVIFIEKMLL